MTAADTAVALGSGSVPVLATPRLLAWMEAVTVQVVALLPELAATAVADAQLTSVGTRVTLTHDRPTPVGTEVLVTARLAAQDGRLLHLEVVAHEVDPAGEPSQLGSSQPGSSQPGSSQPGSSGVVGASGVDDDHSKPPPEPSQAPIGHATISRVLVDRDRFLARITPAEGPGGTGV